MKFLTDENIDFEVVEWLRSQGFDVFDIKEAGLFRTKDSDILDWGLSQKRIVVSQDSDFGTLIFRDLCPFFGVIYLRPGHVEPRIHVQTMATVLSSALDFEPPFICVAENDGEGGVKIRLRKF